MKPKGVFSVPPPPALPPSTNSPARCPGCCCRPWNNDAGAGAGTDDDASHGSLLPLRIWVQGAPRRLLLGLLGLGPPAAAPARPLAPMPPPPIDAPVKQAHMVAAGAAAAARGRRSSRREDDAVAAAAVKPRAAANRPTFVVVGGGSC